MEEIANSVMSSNAQRAGQGRPPLTYEEIRKKTVSKMTQKGKSETAVFSVTGLYSSRSKRESELEGKVKKLENELKQARERKQNVAPPNQTPRGGGGGRGGGRGGRGGAGGGSGQTPSLDKKLSWTCADFNSQAGCKDPCPRSLRHQCNVTSGIYNFSMINVKLMMDWELKRIMRETEMMLWC